MRTAKLPESMDLLLDTMCNTFGGIVFIAISLALAFFVSDHSMSQKKQQEKIEQKLREQKKQETALTEEQKHLLKKAAAYKKLSGQYKSASSNTVYDVAGYKAQVNELKRRMEMTAAETILIKHKRNTAQAETEKLKKKIREKSRKKVDIAAAENENSRLDMKMEKLKTTLQNISVPRLHFSHNRRVAMSPYVILLRNGQLYQLGTNYSVSSREVGVKQDGNILVFSCLSGRPLSSVSSGNLSEILKQYRSTESFLWIMVHPDSFEAFVRFRRLLRSAGYPVYWYTATKMVLYLGKNNYSASY